ncbi:hypothetical protein FSS13T_13390 [Flavobacterium saliperosum S13]|uniref:Uncharacterized protein n=1 Tax=Flavobacterium saliperosum S13 TaxID=1341155 RepID=A0ABP2ZWT0_9FLAO|nr:hypothetical protein FSS13T_13390 [Flavobacterium saliperosum S13]
MAGVSSTSSTESNTKFNKKIPKLKTQFWDFSFRFTFID